MTISNPSDINASHTHFILFVKGNVTFGDIPSGKFNTSRKSMAIISTGQMNIHSNMTEMNGIFIADSFDLAYDTATYSTHELKMTGNLISHMPITDFKRKRDNNKQASLYVVFLPQMYLDLIPRLSTIVQEGRQIN